MEAVNQDDEPLWPDLSPAILMDDLAWARWKKNHCKCPHIGGHVRAADFPGLGVKPREMIQDRVGVWLVTPCEASKHE